MKKIFTVLALASLSIAVMAQENKYEVLTNNFFDNWFISAGVGGEMLIGNNDAHGSVSDRISPTLNIAAGKWFTPGLGLRLQYSGLQSRGYTKDANNGYVDSGADAAGYYKQKFSYMNLHGDVLFNLSSLICGYNPNRIYEAIPYLGAGFTHSYSSPKKEALAINAGLINRFRVSPVLDLNLELAIMGTENKFDGEIGGEKDFDGVLSATVGVTYYFKKRGFNKSKPSSPQLISEAELSSMRNKMNSLAEENMSLKNELAAVPTSVEKEEVLVPELPSHAVFFNIGSTTISEKELMNLEFIANVAKGYSKLKIKTTGYADSKTGSSKRNQELSLKRAESVANALTNTYGVKKENIIIEAAGGVDTFGKDDLNRMVMVEVIK